MEHKITIEILIKTDFLKEKETNPKIQSFKINPKIVRDLIPQLMEGFQKSLPKEEPKKTKSKKVVKK